MSAGAEHDLAVTQQGHYAGAVTRLAAFVVDQTVATGVFSVGTAVLTFVIAIVTGDQVSLDIPPLLLGSSFVVWLFLYYAYPWATSGKTLGMALLGLRVVQRDGAPASVRCAVLRTLALPLSFLLLGLGFVGIVTNREHRALHDRIAGTVVVYDWDARGARLRFLARNQDRAAAASSTAAAGPSAPDVGTPAQTGAAPVADSAS